MIEAYYNLLYDVLCSYDRCTLSNIYRLRKDQVFVFGTDAKGSQRYGAAGLAAKEFGAEVGVTDGLTRGSYAMPTMGCSLDVLGNAILRFEQYARSNRENTFLVTPIGCGHARFKAEEVAPFFRGCIALSNIMLLEEFISFFRKKCIDKLHLKGNYNDAEDTDIYLLYDESVHPVLKYLETYNIPFSKESGFSLVDESDNVIAEAELGIESEKIVFAPFDKNREKVFVSAGYSILSVEEYLLQKRKIEYAKIN